MLSTLHTDSRLQTIVSHFTHLRQGGVANGKALHKPVLILALMDVLEEASSASPDHIPIDEDLYRRFGSIWQKLLPGTRTGDFFRPVLHLPNEGFWQVFTRANHPADKNKKYSSVKGATGDGLWSRFHEDFIGLLSLPEVRDIVRMVILDTYFPETKRRYWDTQGLPELIAQKEALLLVEESAPRYIKSTKFVQFEGYVRYWKFRENVLQLYDHTCCISGLRAQKEILHPLVDACHIQDHAKSGIDHPTNGLALCKNLHAAFDSGLISLSDDYQVLVSKSLRETETAYSLRRLAGHSIQLPARPDFRPDISLVRLHRKQWGF